jgi:PadR family transcriptional regulator, regulatory protein PadR
MAIDDQSAPLSAATLHVLLSLASQDLHGYGIIQEVKRLSGGVYRIGPGTLYDNLKKLMNFGWVEDYEEEQAEEPKRMYRITEDGRVALQTDVSRMKRMLRIAERRLIRKGGEA